MSLVACILWCSTAIMAGGLMVGLTPWMGLLLAAFTSIGVLVGWTEGRRA